jgi:hypothetical protein
MMIKVVIILLACLMGIAIAGNDCITCVQSGQAYCRSYYTSSCGATAETCNQVGPDGEQDELVSRK